MSINGGAGYTPLGDLSSFGSQFNATAAQIFGMISKLSTATLVKVMAVDTNAQTVDILPLVNMQDGNRNPFPYKTIYKKPYWQPQSGISAVMLVPTVGDIGLAIFADRDISKVVATKKQNNPGSYRIMDMSDAIYLGALPGLNAAPTQFMKFDPSSGITIKSTIALTIDAPLTLKSTLTVSGGGAVDLGNSNLSTSGTVTSAGKVLSTHTHPVTSAPGTTGTPT